MANIKRDRIQNILKIMKRIYKFPIKNVAKFTKLTS